MPTIDLNGPDGNAFALMGLVRNIGREIGMETKQISRILDEMRHGNYCDLLNVIDKHFPDIFDFIGDPRDE